jgi:adenosylcobinamide-phosphate synthase
MGSLIAWMKRFRPHDAPMTEFAFGAGLVASGGLLVAGLGALFLKVTSILPAPLAVLGEALLLKATFSGRGLWTAAAEVETALQQDNLPEARRLLSWHLVSRDTSQLTASQVAAATIESVSENTSDGIISPLFWYGVGGLPAALAYRFFNTADAMLGYRDPAHEWLGKVPAIWDDVINWVPARITAVLTIIAAQMQNGRGRQAFTIMRRDAPTTDSPNAGYPMSAMAGALDVELEKVGQYNLGAGQQHAQASDIAKARHILALVTGLFVIGFWISKNIISRNEPPLASG